MTTGKKIALILQTFVVKVKFLLPIMLSSFVTGFLLRSKCLLISWLQEIPPSSREEGLRLLHGLATNLATSLRTPQEA